MSRPVRRALSDAGDRRRAATDFGTNLAVIAGAGTGKTSLLVERLLNAIGAGLAAAGDFAAITFTEKAAAEMRLRLAEGLEELRAIATGAEGPDETKPSGRAYVHLASSSGIARQEIAQRALEVLERLDLVKVTTIHGFCVELLRAHPIEAGVDPGFAVDPGAHRASVFREAWERFVSRELGEAPARADLWGRVLSRTELGKLEALALGERESPGSTRKSGLAGFRLAREAIEAARRPADPMARVGPLVAEAREGVQRVLAFRGELNPAPLAFFEAMDRALDAFAGGGPDALRAMVDGDASLEKWLDDGVPPAGARMRSLSREEVAAAGKAARSLVRDLRRVDEALLADVAEALAPFAAEAREAYLARGFVDFDGLLALTRDLLRRHVHVREALKRRFRTILVDEFQDTDPLQYEIVLFLAEREGGRAADAFEAELAPGKLFIVGDPKQSIYRFRGADYEAFERAVRTIVATGGDRLTLSANFRSGQGILLPVNALFEGERSPWQESRYQPPYIPVCAAEGTGRPEGTVEVWTVRGGRRAEERREAEGLVLAREIRRLHAEGVAYGEILVLLRAFTNLPLYVRPLREAGVPFVVDGGREFMERTEVVQLLAILRALARPSDPVALLAFLRSPAAAATDVELADYAAAGGRWDWREDPPADRFPRLCTAFRLLRELGEETRDLPAEAVVRRVLSRSRLLPLGALAFEGPQRVANLEKLAASAADLARDGTLTLNQVLDALEEMRAGDAEAESPLAEEGVEAVRIMTIHKAKGLESRVVFVADLAREEHREAARGVAAEPVRLASGQRTAALSLDDATNLAWVLRSREEARHGEAERLRLLYVALTRARERLVLLVGRPEENATSRKSEPPWLRALASWGYDPESPPADGARLLGGRVLHRVVEAGPVPAPEPEREPADPEASVAAYRAAAEALRAASAPPLLRPSGEEAEWRAERGRPRRFARAAPDRARSLAVGSVVHGQLARWDQRDAKGLLEGLAERASEAARDQGADTGEVEREARAVLETFLASPLAARLREVEILGRELPLLLGEDGRCWKGSMDLLYREPGGTIAVADYKTDASEDPAELEQRYGEQVAVYARAVARALGLASVPRAELWLLRAGRIVEVGSRR